MATGVLGQGPRELQVKPIKNNIANVVTDDSVITRVSGEVPPMVPTLWLKILKQFSDLKPKVLTGKSKGIVLEIEERYQDKGDAN